MQRSCGCVEITGLGRMVFLVMMSEGRVDRTTALVVYCIH